MKLCLELEEQLQDIYLNSNQMNLEYLGLDHLFLCILKTEEGEKIITALGGDSKTLEQQTRNYITENFSSSNQTVNTDVKEPSPEWTLAAQRTLQRATLQSYNAGKKEISIGHLLVSIFDEDDSQTIFLLSQQGIEQFDVISYISHGITPDQPLSDSTSIETTANPIQSFTVNLNEKAKSELIDPLIGREKELKRIEQILARRTKNHPLLIGEPGVGKTALIEGLALKITQGKVADYLKNTTIYSLDMSALLAGSRFRGDFEQRFKSLIKELETQGSALLFIDELHTVTGNSSSNNNSNEASQLLKPILTHSPLRFIGTTTHKEYRNHIEKDHAFARRFQNLEIIEPSQQETLQILKGLQTKFEDHHKVKYSSNSLKTAVQLSSKHISDKNLPDKAIDVIDEAGARIKLQRPSSTTITTTDISKIVSEIARIPLDVISTDDRKLLQNLESQLKSVIFGQDKAIEHVCSSIKMSRSGLARHNKPVGSYLFAGPTGVGKTELCKQLAHFLGSPFLRFDMSEYMEKHSVSKLVGAPPGYVGFDNGGQLTEAVNKTPYCVLLLDEIEKAHADLIAILLQVMDDGRLTDSNGRTTNFRNCVLIMTTNAGAQNHSRSMGIIPESNKGISLAAIKKTFAPEFRNRLDAIITFDELKEEVILNVIEKLLKELSEQLKEKRVQLKYDVQVKKHLLKKGYDPNYGARPLERTINELIKQPMVDELLFGQISRGGKITLNIVNNEISFNYKY